MSDNATVSATSLRGQVAEEVRVLLARRKLSASELARMIGVTQPYMSRRLNGDTAFDIDDLARVATALGVEVSDLFPRSDQGHLVVAAGVNHSTNTRRAVNNTSSTRADRLTRYTVRRPPNRPDGPNAYSNGRPGSAPHPLSRRPAPIARTHRPMVP